MQLAITILGKTSTLFIAPVLAAVNTHKCNILELSLSDFSHSCVAVYLLVEGSWNYLAKLENSLDCLEKQLDIKVSSLHVDPQEVVCDYIPYNLEIIAIDHTGILDDMLTFLLSHQVIIEDIKASCYPASYTQTPLFSCKFIILIPLAIHLLSFREEMLNFCDNCNIDAVFEPIKR